MSFEQIINDKINREALSALRLTGPRAISALSAEMTFSINRPPGLMTSGLIVEGIYGTALVGRVSLGRPRLNIKPYLSQNRDFRCSDRTYSRYHCGKLVSPANF